MEETLGELNGKASDPYTQRIENIIKRRSWLRNTDPFKISPIVTDIVFYVYTKNYEGETVNISEVVRHCRGSERAVRGHIKSLIEGGWLSLERSSSDRRQSLLKVSERVNPLMRQYIDLD